MKKTQTCIKCNTGLSKDTFCYKCDTLQIDINSVNWTLKTCNKCCSIQPADLDPNNPFCFDCKIFIRTHDQKAKKINKETNPPKFKVEFFENQKNIDENGCGENEGKLDLELNFHGGYDWV